MTVKTSREVRKKIIGWNIEVVTEDGDVVRLNCIPNDIAQVMDRWFTNFPNIGVEVKE
tara:strand:+ start:438 stop:611 length:174 start_codon:yes stop_codon:yes gene_type:complete